MSPSQARRTRSVILIILLGFFLALLYTELREGFRDWFPVINTLIMGTAIGCLTAGFEIYLYKRKIWKLKFWKIITVRTVYYLAGVVFVIFFETAVARMIRYNVSFTAVLQSDEYRNYLFHEDFLTGILYAFCLILVFNFIRQMSKKIGYFTFWNFITGRYVKPVSENRIFMFLKINNSGNILERTGRYNFFSLYNELIYDITEPILAHRGNIYEYVDDVIVISWMKRSGIKNANCVRVFFEAKLRLQEKKERYFSKYNVLLDLNAALHRGNVVHGEVGAIKSKIAFAGDVMNTTARILNICDPEGKELLISDELLKDLELPVIYHAENCGSFRIKGKKDEIVIHSIHEPEPAYV